jgi:hypothetical protein
MKRNLKGGRKESFVADLQVEGNELILHLSKSEVAEAIHGELRAPLVDVTSVEILDDAHDAADHGLKTGTRIPGVIEVGTVHSDGKRIFTAVHRSTPRGVRVVLQNGSFDEWIVGCEDPESVAAQIKSSL